ncbi:MAG: hypothetical protein MRJ96_04845 [Nitrospirales bacterium]|nr:hypothetical protein [Nitrospira sp.]MDR4500768.1 hypothetical protein [Nitrospirales bacterium]
MNMHCLSLRQMNGRRRVPMLIVLLVSVLMIVQPAVTLAEEESSPAEEAGLGIGSGLLSLVYFPLKLVYATLGGIVGGFTYVLTGGDLETAQTVWEPSFYGTYIITPAHLRGDEAVRFYGVSPYEDEQ